MKLNLRTAATLAVLAVVGINGSAKAAALFNVQVLGSTTGTAGSYTNNLSDVAAGTTIFYEVVGQFASGATNSNTTKVPNGTQDALNSLNTLALSDNGGTFGADSINSLLAQGTGNSAGINTGTSITGIRLIGANGVYTNADAQLVLVSGTFTTAASTVGIGVSEDTSSSSAYKIAGTGPTSIIGANSTTETSLDPINGFTGLVISGNVSPVPAPSALAGLIAITGACSVGVIARRRSMLA